MSHFTSCRSRVPQSPSIAPHRGTVVRSVATPRRGAVSRASANPRAGMALRGLLAILALLGTFGLSSGQHTASAQPLSQAPRAGTNIVNRAQLSFVDGFSQLPVTIESNPVSTIVQPLEALTLTPDNSQRVLPGAQVDFAHRLTNTGNAPTQFTFRATQDTNDVFDFTNLRLYRDANGNGALDAGEVEIRPGQTVSLEPGETLDVIVSGTVPTTATPGDTARVYLEARTGAQNQVALVTDTAQVVQGFAPQLRKSANPTSASPNDLVTFTIRVSNLGTGTPQGIAASVDGTARTLIIVRDPIPANTTYDLLAVPQGGLALYHRAGDALQTYTTTAPDKALIDAVAVGYETFPAEAFSIALRVRLNASVGGSVNNTASLFYNDPNGTQAARADSNVVTVAAPQPAPTLTFYQSGAYNTVQTSISPGQPLFLEGVDGACNQDPTRIETTIIRLSSALTGDVEELVATETAPNSGVFRVSSVPTKDGKNVIVTRGNGILEIVPRDTLTARLSGCGTAEAVTTLLVDPSGVVYDSRTNQPIPGARVTLVDASGNPASVLDNNGAPAPSTVVTGPDGSYLFPFVVSGNYRLLIEPPAGYTFPSKLPPALQPNGRNVDANGSYGRGFIVGNSAVLIDVPLDPQPAGLFVEKVASRTQVEIGDWVDYQVRARNATGNGLTGVTLTDRLPGGFIYEKGSARLNGARLADPATRGPLLEFVLPNVAADATVVVSYRVRIGAGSRIGDAINRAQMQGTSPFGAVISNVAGARVSVKGGVLTDKGILFGKVYLDSNLNGVQDKGEVGVPGVRVWIEDGSFAITDSEGKYNLYGISPRTHVVKADPQTVPNGAAFLPLDLRHAGKGDFVFADLKRAEMHKVNFALRAPQGAAPEAVTALQKEIAARRSNAQKFEGEVDNGDLTRTLDATTTATTTGELSTSANTALLPSTGIVSRNGITGANGSISTLTDNRTTFAGESSLADRAASVASGLTVGTGNGTGLNSGLTSGTASATALTSGTNLGVGPRDSGLNGGRVGNTDAGVPRRVRNGEEKVRSPLNANNSNLPPLPIRVAPSLPLEDAIAQADNTLGFVDLRDGDMLPINQANVRVKGVQGGALQLFVNGKEVPATRIGKKAEAATKQLMAYEFIGVGFQPGRNTLELRQNDTFGNERGKVTISIIAPGDLGRLRLFAPRGRLYADGKTVVPIRIRVEDANGTPIGTRTLVTLESSYGRWLVPDLNRLEPGTQIFVEGGEREVQLVPPADPADCLVRATSGVLSSSVLLAFRAELRPLIAAGVLESGLRLGGAKERSLAPSDPDNAAEEDFFRLGGSDTRARSALFAKGRILDDTLLTLQYDSKRNRDEQLFRDIRPDDFYPIYGDSSVKGFDAQSTRKLYARLDRDRSYLLYGDFSTDVTSLARSLGSYNRALTGSKAHFENGRLSANAFASRDNARQIVDERRGVGTSGPYLLSTADIVEGSERVEILVRDRNQPSVVLSTAPQSRFTDYELDYYTGRLLFRAPIPSSDANLNPIFIRVTYEARTGGENFLVAGLDAQYKLARNLEIGGAFARDNAPGASRTLSSVNATLQLGKGTYLIGEVAHSNNEGVGGGTGQRLELLHESSKLQARVFAGQTDSKFSNPSSLLASGRQEVSARAVYQAGKSTRVVGEAIRTKDELSGGTRQGAYAGVEQNFGKGIQLDLGLRTARESGTPAQSTSVGGTPTDFTTVRARLAAPIPFLRRAKGYAEYEQALSDSSKNVFALGGEYQLSDRSRLYLRHEFASSLSGLYGLNDGQEQHATVFGIDTDFLRNGQLYSEYRVNNALSGREAQAAIGLRNQWSLAPGLRLQTSFERLQPLGNSTPGSTLGGLRGNAATAALEYTLRENLKATGRLEARNGDQRAILANAGLIYRPNQDISLLVRGILNSQSATGSLNGGLQQRLQLGLAYRPTETDRWNTLLRYEYRYDRDAALGLSAPGVSTGGLFLDGERGKRHLISGDINYQAARRLRTSLHIAAKLNRDDSQGLSSRGALYFASGRLTYDLSQRSDFSLFAGSLSGAGNQIGLGAEFGYLIRSDLWITAGYSFAGYRDADLVDEALRRRGPYLRLRWKFDENTFGLGRSNALRTASATPDAATLAMSGNNAADLNAAVVAEAGAAPAPNTTPTITTPPTAGAPVSTPAAEAGR